MFFYVEINVHKSSSDAYNRILLYQCHLFDHLVNLKVMDQTLLIVRSLRVVSFKMLLKLTSNSVCTVKQLDYITLSGVYGQFYNGNALLHLFKLTIMF